ncbi:MAG: mercury resistance system transport protein MerF [Chloroflexota bacterium]
MTAMMARNGVFRVGVVGSVVAALCCAGVLTPLLVAGLTAAGLGALTRTLDLVLLTALPVFLVLTALGWWLRRRRDVPEAASAAPGEASEAST